MRYWIHSTLTNDHLYTQWTRPEDKNLSPEVIPDPVFIKGGANRATFPDDRFGRHTPRGVMTEVTERQMEYLEGCWNFQRHKKRGLITVTTSKEDPEDIARDMHPKDNSAPLTDSSPELNKPDPPTAPGEGIVAKAVRVMQQAVG
jgi:hypothetical protein